MYRTAYSLGSILFSFIIWTACSPNAVQESLPYYNTPDFTPIFAENQADISQQISHTIGAFQCTDQHGQPISEKDITDKIHVASFIFTSCGSICPIMTKHMKRVQKTFADADDFAILSYSVTPWIDSVARLNAYAKRNEITASNWHLLTGKKGEIYDLARKSYFAEEDIGFTKDSTEFLHTEHFILVDKSKRIRGIYNGTLQLEISQLIADISTLQKE